LGSKTGSNSRREAKLHLDGKHKRKKYTSEIYGARLEFEDARILDDYGKVNKLDRSDVVRLGLHQFALRQQMRHHKKDPLRETLEQIVAEKIEPLNNHVEEVAVALHEVAEAVIQIRQTQPDGIEFAHTEGEFASEQKQLIEQTLMAAMLALRLHVNYLVEPVLRGIEARSGSGAEVHLQAAIQGRDRWCETTREVITRTGNRILFELNMITKEDWEKLLNVYERASKG
jgi:hypothetical protein